MARGRAVGTADAPRQHREGAEVLSVAGDDRADRRGDVRVRVVGRGADADADHEVLEVQPELRGGLRRAQRARREREREVVVDRRRRAEQRREQTVVRLLCEADVEQQLARRRRSAERLRRVEPARVPVDHQALARADQPHAREVELGRSRHGRHRGASEQGDGARPGPDSRARQQCASTYLHHPVTLQPR